MKEAFVLAMFFHAQIALAWVWQGPECLSPEAETATFPVQVEIQFRVDQNCEIVDQTFIPEFLSEAVKEATLCLARWAPPPVDPESPYVSDEEYATLLKEHRTVAPNEYHSRSINVETSTGTKARLTCYFTEKWTPTFAELVTVVEGLPRIERLDDFESLPIQRFLVKFASESKER